MDINMIKKVVAETTGIDLNDKELNARRISENVEARTMYFSLAREFTTLSLANIGKTIKPQKWQYFQSNVYDNNINNNINKCFKNDQFNKNN